MLTKCPYCGKKISYFKLFFERKHGEFFCPDCRKESKISIDKKIIFAFIFIIILSIIIGVLLKIFTGYENPLTFLLILIPYAVFFLISPVFVVLRPYRKYKEWMTAHTSLSNK